MTYRILFFFFFFFFFGKLLQASGIERNLFDLFDRRVS